MGDLVKLAIGLMNSYDARLAPCKQYNRYRSDLNLKAKQKLP